MGSCAVPLIGMAELNLCTNVLFMCCIVVWEVKRKRKEKRQRETVVCACKCVTYVRVVLVFL